MTGQLSTYSQAGSGVSDQVATQLRRLVNGRHVNVWDFMTDAQVTDVKSGALAIDMTSAIQAAIDYAYNNRIHGIYLPGGSYKITSTVYLDPPLGLRASNPNLAQFSLSFFGEKGGTNDEQTNASRLIMATDDFIGLMIGPGQGNYVGDLIIRPQNLDGTWVNQSVSGVGLGIAGGSGGATRTVIERVSVRCLYNAFKTSANGYDALCDSNTFYKCWSSYCNIGFYFSKTQNFINTLYDCTSEVCRIAVKNDVGCNVNVIGGNYSVTGAPRGFVSVSGLGNITPALGSGASLYTFTVNVSPVPTEVLKGAYDIYAFETSGHGIVPCSLVSFNVGSGQLTLQVMPAFLETYYSNTYVDLSTATNLFTDMAACTSIAGATRTYGFIGAGTKVQGIHLENPQAVHTMVYSQTGFGNDEITVMKDVFMNNDPSMQPYPTDALYLCQSGVPFIECTAGQVIIDRLRVPSADSLTIDQANNPTVTVQVKNMQLPQAAGFTGCSLFNTRGRVVNTDRLNIAPYTSTWNQSVVRGFGMYDYGYSKPHGVQYSSDRYLPLAGMGTSHHGYGPSPYLLPRTTGAQVDAITNGTFTATSHDMLHGDAIHSVLDQHEAARKYLFARHIGIGYTYGQDLSIPWRYVGKSGFVYLTGGSASLNIKYIFPGLSIILNNGSGDTTYVVLGVWYSKNMFAVVQPSSGPSLATLDGTKGTTYTGSTIKQTPYNVKKYGRQCEFGSAAPSSGAWTVGDICYSTDPASTGYLGWVCTVAGSPGTWKTFGAVTA